MRLFFALLAAVFVGACATSPVVNESNLAMQAYQTHEFETSKRAAFDATMSVLQDSGFIIESADFDTGFITGKGTTKSRTDFWYGVMNEGTKMTATVQTRGTAGASVRINLVETQQRKSLWNTTQDVINEDGVRDPEVYQLLFEQIDKTIFVRRSLQ